MPPQAPHVSASADRAQARARCMRVGGGCHFIPAVADLGLTSSVHEPASRGRSSVLEGGLASSAVIGGERLQERDAHQEINA